MSCLANFITSLDIFGQGIQLRINKEAKARTIIGGILSILMIFSLTAMFFLSASEVFYKENPQVNLEDLIVHPVPELILNITTMPIGISLTDAGNTPLDLPQYFDYKVFINYGNTSEDLIRTELETLPCTKSMFPNVRLDIYDSLVMDSRLCIKNQTISIQGAFSDPYMSFLEIGMLVCQNSTERICAPYEEIRQYIRDNEIYMNLYMMDTLINPQNYSDPLAYKILNIYKKVKFEFQKSCELYIKNMTLKSDDGFIFPNVNELTGVSVDYQEKDDGDWNDSGILIAFYLFASDKKYTYHRRYKKIQEILASVGGLTNIVIYAFTLICYIFSAVKRDVSIQNRIFDYDLFSGKKRSTPIDNIIQNANNNILPVINNIDKRESANLNTHFIFRKPNSENSLVNKKLHNTERIAAIPPNHTHSKNQMIQLFPHERKNSKNVTSTGSIVKHFKSVSFLHMKDESDSINAGILNNELNNDANISFSQNNHLNDAKQILAILNTRKKNYELNFSFCEIIKGFLCCNSCSNNDIRFKKSLYKKSNFVVEEFLDITNIIQKLDELEKLKIVILNNEQLALFNFIAKEFISLDEEKLANHYMTQFKLLNKDKEQLANLIIEFKQKLSSDSRDIKDIDRKLYNLLNEEFK